MNTHVLHPRLAANLRQQQATRGIFFVAGLGMASWAPLIPFVKSRLGIDDGPLGLLLFCIAAGSMLVMPFAGRAIARFGCRALILACAAVFCLILPFMMQATSAVAIGGALLVFGAVNGLLDVSMNAQAVIVERDSGQARMSGFHGFYSLGGVAGAGGVSLLLWAGLMPLQAILLVVVLIALVVMQASTHLLPRRPTQSAESEGTLQALAHPGTLFIALLCFFIFMVEGAMLDWSAVFLHTERGMEKSHAGFGYTLYSIAVALGRLYGDRLVNAIGRQRMLMLGGACATVGLLLIVLVDLPGIALAGFILTGIGLSNIVPILFTAAGNQAGVPSSFALSAVTLVGYTGLLSGPALIGLVAHHSSLTTAFSAGVVIMLLVCCSARRITR
ncbi:MFS transporter [Pseudomonas gingeri]|uniref:MFS transporter n=1 Tax=Pseudomonas gingeri TaxID=117681 RepID=UPI0015A4590F|nr:MFS transporter [Pseudomonas gingeri]NWA17916.1 MFS transporter [Pseudomonas gingeri]NWA56829.1 MFS transporter [Pseudomonas gingeri]NWA97132.1 MFS transporter [Pseudomonas gingeri]NWB03667.1 MFS transporter [Pseudomonas gingeri]